jgi:hypothetical protein
MREKPGFAGVRDNAGRVAAGIVHARPRLELAVKPYRAFLEAINDGQRDQEEGHHAEEKSHRRSLLERPRGSGDSS